MTLRTESAISAAIGWIKDRARFLANNKKTIKINRLSFREKIPEKIMEKVTKNFGKCLDERF